MTDATCRLALVILAVDDLARARTFYDAAFGWMVRVEVPVYIEYDVAGGMRVGLYLRRGFERNTAESAAKTPPEGTTSTELYLYADDLDAALTRMTLAGARVLNPRAPRDWGDEAAYFADPDGNVLVLARAL